MKARTASVQTGDHTVAEQGLHDPHMGMVGLGVMMVVNMVEFKNHRGNKPLATLRGNSKVRSGEVGRLNLIVCRGQDWDRGMNKEEKMN